MYCGQQTCFPQSSPSSIVHSGPMISIQSLRSGSYFESDLESLNDFGFGKDIHRIFNNGFSTLVNWTALLNSSVWVVSSIHDISIATCLKKQLKFSTQGAEERWFHSNIHKFLYVWKSIVLYKVLLSGPNWALVLVDGHSKQRGFQRYVCCEMESVKRNFATH